MENNMSGIEQAIRFIVGFAILIYAGLYLCCTNLVVAVIIGGVLVVTGGIGYCPLYALLKKPAQRQEQGQPMSEERFNKNVEYKTGQTTKSKKPFAERKNLKR
jgi:hypothetical protein